MENLYLCKKLKKFLLYGFTIIPDHVHLLLKPDGEYNVSQIIQFLKRHISRDINFVLGINNEGEIRESRLQNGESRLQNGESRLQNGNKIYIKFHDEKLIKIKNLFKNKYGSPRFAMPSFHWQQSFHDHVIRNERDFNAHLNYIASNCVKHNICQDEEDYQWSFLNKRFDFLLEDF